MTGRLKVLLTRKLMHALKRNNLSDILDGIWRGVDQQKWSSLQQPRKVKGFKREREEKKKNPNSF